MKYLATLLLSFALVSCMSVTEEKTTDLTANTITEKNKAFALGGKFANRWGAGAVWNGEKSFRDGALAAGAIAAGYFSAATSAAEQVTSRVQAKQAAQTAQKATEAAAAVDIQKSADAVKMAEIAAEAGGP